MKPLCASQVLQELKVESAILEKDWYLNTTPEQIIIFIPSWQGNIFMFHYYRGVAPFLVGQNVEEGEHPEESWGAEYNQPAAKNYQIIYCI